MFWSKKLLQDKGQKAADASPALTKAEAIELGKILFREWRDELNQECSAHLLFIDNFKDDDWNKGEVDGDLQAVITQYCGAVDGTEETANGFFKRYEERAAELGLSELIHHTKLRKLQHLMQLRTYFEYKLKLNLVPSGADRERLRQDASLFLNPELGEQF